MKNSLYELVRESYLGNKEVTMILINKFNPLIKKYSRKLNYDGADTDLTIHLIEVLKAMPIENTNMKKDKYLLGYIGKSLRHKYIKLSKKYCSTYANELELNEEILEISDNMNMESYIIVKNLLNKLPSLQERVLKDLFMKGYKVSEVAENLNVSRQAVNKTKNRALKNLKKYFQIDCSLA